MLKKVEICSEVEFLCVFQQLWTYHPANGSTDGVGLGLTVEAAGHFVNLKGETQTEELMFTL